MDMNNGKVFSTMGGKPVTGGGEVFAIGGAGSTRNRKPRPATEPQPIVIKVRRYYSTHYEIRVSVSGANYTVHAHYVSAPRRRGWTWGPVRKDDAKRATTSKPGTIGHQIAQAAINAAAKAEETYERDAMQAVKPEEGWR